MNDDFEDDVDLDDDDSFEDFDSSEKSLGDLWQKSPLFKVLALGVAAVVVFGTVTYFGGDSIDPGQSVLPAGSEVSAPPGTEEASPNYVEAVEEENEARIEQAFSQGGSALPTPIDPPQERLSVPKKEVEKEDPLQRWRQLQEKRLQRELRQAQSAPVENVQSEAQTEAVQAMSQAMSQQMQAVLEGRYRAEIKTQSITDAQQFFGGSGTQNVSGSGNSGNNNGGGDNNGGGNAGNNNNNGNSDSGFFEDEGLENFQNTLLPAGEILYAQLLTEANSDIPGPILAQIVTGPLAGGRLIGSFTVNGKLLTLNFETLVLDGTSVSINSVAIDPQTTLTGLATDVDNRYLERIVFPAAAAFVEGFSEAISESGRTTITVSGEVVAAEEDETSNDQEVASGFREAGEEIGEILDEAGEVEPLIRVETGTPMGILFLEPVIEDENAI